MTTKIDGATGVAVAGLVIGWFGLNSLEATFGPIQHVAHFYDLPVVLRDPRRLLTGWGGVDPLGRIVFGTVCAAAILAALLARLGETRMRRTLSAAPLILMVVCAIVLYVRASTAHIEAPESMGRLGGLLSRWANGAMSWSGDVVARHITIGAGGYLSFISSLYLALAGTSRPRGIAPDPT